MSGQSFSETGPLSWSDIRARMVGGSGSVSLGPKRALLDGIGTSSAVSASDFQGRGPEFANEFGMPPSTWFPGGTGERSRNPFRNTTIPYVAPNTSQIVLASPMGCMNNHTVAVRADGRVFAWGPGSFGQLGTGNTSNQLTPTGTSLGQMGSWNVVSIACGDAHTVAVRADGRVFAWGRGNSGQLGTGNTSDQTTPTGTSLGQMGSWNVVSIGCGAFHTVALRADGRVFAWGFGNSGQLGTGNTSGQTTPTGTSLGQMGSWNVVSIACGVIHTVALRADGRVFAWGRGGNGQLGTGNTSNQLTPTGTSLGQMGSWNVVSIACGLLHTVAVRADGRVFAWGSGVSGRLGTGNTNFTNPTPLGVSLGQMGSWNVVAIACGVSHTVAVRADGRLFAWGSGSSGPLGNGNTDTQLTPTGVSLGQMPSLEFF